MKKVKIAVLASMVGLLALFGVSAQTIVHRPNLVPAGSTPATTTAVAPTATVAQADQSGNHEFEGEEPDSNGQAENGTEKPDAQESGAIEQGGTKSALGAQTFSPENESVSDTDNVQE